MGNTKGISAVAKVDRNHLEGVQAQIAFVQRSSDEQPTFAGPPSYGAPALVSHDVTIRNARPIVDELSLDREGFGLIKQKMSCANERDPEIMCSKHLEEMAAFVKDYFKASWVTTYQQGPIKGAIIRSADGSRGRGPAGFAHIDFSPIAGPVVAAISDQEHGRPIRAYSRLMLIQAWRVLSPPPQDLPLAFCDGTTVVDTDLLDSTMSRDGVTHKSWLVHYSPLQRWYYFPDMTEDEVILFKGYDSQDNYNPRSPHTAFDNRRVTPNAKPRVSLESRFFVYFE